MRVTSASTNLKVAERRQAVWQTLLIRRYDTAVNLAAEFGVSVRTMQGDLRSLIGSHPVESMRGSHGGGFKVLEWYHPHKSSLCLEQLTVLRSLEQTLPPYERQVIRSIIDQFAPT